MVNHFNNPANDYYKVPTEKMDRISFKFVCGDADISSSCTIGLGSIDPMTGKPITDIRFFTEYNKLVNRQVDRNLKNCRVELTPEEEARFKAEKAAFRAEFERKYGYKPTRSDIREGLKDRWPENYHLSIQAIVNDCGESKADQRMDLSTPAPDPFDTEAPVDVAALHEVAKALTGRLADVLDAMLTQFSGGEIKISQTELARKWGVSVRQIGYDQDKIIRMIRKAVEAAKNDQD